LKIIITNRIIRMSNLRDSIVTAKPVQDTTIG
jgi:hypothetical protein